MRHSLLATSLCFLVALTPCVSVAGDVLLPSSSGNHSSSTPDLGLGGPTPSTPAPVATTASPPAASPPTPSTDTPPAVITGGASTAALPANSPISPIDQASAAQLPPDVVPTQVIQQPDVSSALAQMNDGLPSSISISISGKSIFGARDVPDHHRKTGAYPRTNSSIVHPDGARHHAHR